MFAKLLYLIVLPSISQKLFYIDVTHKIIIPETLFINTLKINLNGTNLILEFRMLL